MSIADLKQRLRDIPGIETLTMQMLAGRQVYSFAGRVVGVDAAASDREVQEAIRASVSSAAIVQLPAGTPVQHTASAGAADVPAPASISEPTVQAQNVGQSPASAGEASPVSGTSPATNTMPVEREGTAATSIEGNSAPSRSADLIPQVHVTAPAPATVQPKAKTMNTGAAHAALSLRQLMEQRKAQLADKIAGNMAKLQSGFDKQDAAADALGSLGDKAHADGDDLLATVGQYANDLGLS